MSFSRTAENIDSDADDDGRFKADTLGTPFFPFPFILSSLRSLADGRGADGVQRAGRQARGLCGRHRHLAELRPAQEARAHIQGRHPRRGT